MLRRSSAKEQSALTCFTLSAIVPMLHFHSAHASRTERMLPLESYRAGAWIKLALNRFTLAELSAQLAG